MLHQLEKEKGGKERKKEKKRDFILIYRWRAKARFSYGEGHACSHSCSDAYMI
jgi:hypothetical protein